MQKDGLQVIDCIIKPTMPITAIEQQLCKVDLLNREENTLGTWGKRDVFVEEQMCLADI